MADALPPWNDPRVIWVCENHPWRTWDTGLPTDCDCGAAGMPLRTDLTALALMDRVAKYRAQNIEAYGGVGEWVTYFEEFFRILAGQSDRVPGR